MTNLRNSTFPPFHRRSRRRSARQFVQAAHQKPVKAVKPVFATNKKAPPSHLDGAEREEKLRNHYLTLPSRGHPLKQVYCD